MIGWRQTYLPRGDRAGHMQGGAVMWAQTDMGSWSGVVSSVISAGFAAVVAWYLLTKALPKMADRQEDTIREQRTAFQTVLINEQQIFERVMQTMQDKYDRREEQRRSEDRAALETVLMHCHDEAVRSAALHKIELSSMQRELQDHGEILEDVRDRLLERDARKYQRKQPPPEQPPT